MWPVSELESDHQKVRLMGSFASHELAIMFIALEKSRLCKQFILVALAGLCVLMFCSGTGSYFRENQKRGYLPGSSKLMFKYKPPTCFCFLMPRRVL